MKLQYLSRLLPAAVIIASATAAADGNDDQNAQLRDIYDESRYFSNAIEFPQFVVGDPVKGRGVFGLNASGNPPGTEPQFVIDPTQGGIISGTSVIYGPVTPNGTVCASCHRPENDTFMLPRPPISAGIPANDPGKLLSGRNSEAQGDPRQAAIFENHGLLKQRVNRFNPLLRHPAADQNPDAYHVPYFQVFAWRKTQTIYNVVFGFGYLTEGRSRHLIEQGRGAFFTHTQDTDIRFDDLVNPHLNDVAAWQETIVTQQELLDLLNPSAPLHDALVNDPFYTVHPSNDLEQRGEEVFAKNCMGCHNMPNVFGNRDHVPAPPANFPPLFGHTFDIGVAQRNRWNLDVRAHDATTNTFTPVQLSLAREDGTRVTITVVDDLGAAMTTGRYEDLHRFKVPQLRRIKDFGPYFHDNSALTLEEVVDYFNSDDYNRSPDGRKFPIHIEGRDRDALLAFLRIL